MATPTVNFKSYNSTELDTIKAKWLRDLISVSRIDFCSIQEHFKKNVGSFFSTQFSDFHTYLVPAVREKNTTDFLSKSTKLRQ